MNRLVVGQRGVSYPLGYVLVAPFYLSLMLFAVEAGFLMFAQLGTHDAAYAAAHATIRWRHAEPAAKREVHIRQAASKVLAGFVGGRQHEIDEAGPIRPGATDEAQEFAEATQRYLEPTGRTLEADFLARKYLNADTRLDIDIDPPLGATMPPHAETTVTVRFRAPLYLPVVSRFLDPDQRAPFEYPLESTATLPGDGPISRNHKLGIAYQARPVRR